MSEWSKPQVTYPTIYVAVTPSGGTGVGMSDYDTMAAIRALVNGDGYTRVNEYRRDTGQHGPALKGFGPVVTVLIWMKRRVDRAFKAVFGWCHPKPVIQRGAVSGWPITDSPPGSAP